MLGIPIGAAAIPNTLWDEYLDNMIPEFEQRRATVIRPNRLNDQFYCEYG